MTHEVILEILRRKIPALQITVGSEYWTYSYRGVERGRGFNNLIELIIDFAAKMETAYCSSLLPERDK